MSSVEINYNVTVINNINESEGIDIMKIIEIVVGLLTTVMGLFTVYRCTCKGKGRSDKSDIETGSMNDNENIEMGLESTLRPEEDDIKQSLVPTSHHPEEPPANKTWVLRVFIHCEGCKRKVFKLLHTIAGVYETVIDEKEDKVTVTGTVSGETLVQKLLKWGKHAEILPESFEASVKEVKGD